ncbi:MAG: hypothetical protein LBE84_09965 [Planctomycetota bacterium]|nr:hypothetical protein [Planctomycetota bacterium]
MVPPVPTRTSAFRQRRGKSIGAVWAAGQVVENLGVIMALGEGRQAQLAL